MRYRIFAIILFAILFVANYAFGAVGKVTVVKGKVDVLRTGATVAVPVKEGDPVNIGDIFRTKTNSALEITFDNKNVLRLAPQTRVEIKEYMVEEKTSSQIVKLYRGRVQAIAGQEFIKRVAAFAEGNKFEVHTPNAVAGIRGSNMLVGIMFNVTVVIFVEGHGYTYNTNVPAVVVPVSAGTMTYVVGEAPPTPPSPAPESMIKDAGQAFIKVERVETTEQKATETEIVAVAPEVTPAPPPIVREEPPTITRSFVEETPPPPQIPQIPLETNFTGTIMLPDIGEGTFSAKITKDNTGTLSALVPYEGTLPETFLGLLYGTSDKGGAFYGPGVVAKGSLIGLLSTFYVEGGSVYFLSGDLSGAYDGKNISLGGSLIKSPSLGTITLKAEPSLLDALRSALIERELPQFFGESYVIGDSGIKIYPSPYSYKYDVRILLTDKKILGTIAATYSGIYETTEEKNVPYFGVFYPYSCEDKRAFVGVGPINSVVDETTKSLSLDFNLKTIGYDPDFGPFIGDYSMKYVGNYYVADYEGQQFQMFRMVGAGNLDAQKADIFGTVSGGLMYYDKDENYLKPTYYFGPSIEGVLAGIGNLWTDGSAKIYMMGKYVDEAPESYLGKPRLAYGSGWYFAYFPQVYAQGMIGGAFYGFNVGLWMDEKINTEALAIYISPEKVDGKYKAGYLGGMLEGKYYPGIDMWELSGTLKPTFVETTSIDPGELQEKLKYHYFEGKVAGKSNGASMSGSFAGIASGLKDHDWGIWNVGMGGTYEGNVTNQFDFGGYVSYGYILGHANTQTEGSTFKGALYDTKVLTPDIFGTLEGNIYGTFDSDLSTWQAAGIGKYKLTPLSFGSSFFGQFFNPKAGTLHEGEYIQETMYEPAYYSFAYIKPQDGKGIGIIENDLSMIYFPDLRALNWHELETGYQDWDIANIENISKPPSWWGRNYFPSSYTETSGIQVLELGTGFSGVFGSEGYPWDTTQVKIHFIGKSWNEEGFSKPAIFASRISDGIFNDTEQIGFYSLDFGGIIKVNNDVLAAGLGIFVGGGKAGVFRTDGILSGKFYDTISMIDLEGKMVSKVKEQISNQSELGIQEGVLVSRLFGESPSKVRIGSSIFPTSGTTQYLDGRDWGTFTSTVWSGVIALAPDQTLPNEISTILMGYGGFGEYERNGQTEPDFGFFLGPAVTLNLKDGIVSVPFTGEGKFMTQTKMGKISDIGLLGIYSSPSDKGHYTLYSWQGLMGGYWEKTEDLTFFSNVEGSTVRFFERTDGGLVEDGLTKYVYSYENERGVASIKFYDYDQNGVRKTAEVINYGDIPPFDQPGVESFKYDYTTKSFSDYSVSVDYPGPTFDTAFFEDLASSRGYSQHSDSVSVNGLEFGGIWASMGGKDNLWEATEQNPAKVYFLGDYDRKWSYYGPLPVVFGADLESYNAKNDTFTTLDDKGAYTGFIAGRVVDDSIDGVIYALYLQKIDGSKSKAGILKGQFSGNLYYENAWEGEGSIYPIELFDEVNVSYKSFEQSEVATFEKGDGSEHALFVNDSSVSTYDFGGKILGISGLPGLGLLGMIIGGKIETQISSPWNTLFSYERSDQIMGIMFDGTHTDKKIDGFAYGYGAAILFGDNEPEPVTWVSVGDVKGVFNPVSNHFTLVSLGPGIETSKFLELTATEAGRQKLSQLGIPSVQVGVITFSGSGNGFSELKMENTKFFARSSGEKPVIWATGNVSGTYTSAPSLNNPITLSAQNGGVGSVDFTFTRWDSVTSTWLSKISGNGVQVGNHTVDMMGAGAGTIHPSGNGGTISGTASGIAK